jgi:type IV pilus assembly protein PilY1
MNNHYFKSVVTAGLLALSMAAPAEDIDLFVNQPANTDLPSLLMILDNSANWTATLDVPNCYYKDDGVATLDGPKAENPGKEQGTKMAIEKCALYNAIDGLKVNADGSARIKVGLMLFNQSPASSSGGYPRQAFIPLDNAGKAALKAVIRNLSMDDDKGNNAAFTKTLHEAYLYFKGSAPYRGTAGTKWDSSAVSGGLYVSPSSNSCGRNHIIFIANGSPGEVTDGEAKTLLSGVGGDVTQITYPTSLISNSDQANWADEYARFMRGADVSNKEDAQGIITHGIAVTGAASDGNYPNFIEAMADHGYGSFHKASNVDELTIAIQDAVGTVLAENSAFASVSLPVSVNTQGTFLNQVYVGVFRPHDKSGPRWAGNLKHYKLGYDTNNVLALLDADNKSAINSTTGFIHECARSYWTPTATDKYWTENPQGGCLSILDSEISNSPDGNIVEKGGQAFKLRSITLPSTRKVLTCDSGCAGVTAFNNTSVTQDDLGATDPTEWAALIDWARGLNVDGELKKPTDVMRPSVHGDVVHSRPVAINYGTDAAPEVVVFYGANDGMLHAINGNRDGGLSIGTQAPGMELWSFMAPEFYLNIKRIRDNTTPVSYFGSETGEPKPYGFDGPTAAYKDATQAIVYAAMRRGGRALYAFDVTTPATPALKWKHDATSLPNLGQTWSAPKILTATGYDSPMLIMAGGYDTCEDADPHVCTTSTTGNRIYVMDAVDGTLKQTLNTDRAVVADVVVVPDRATGLAKHAYAVDLGGNVYRINIGTAAPADWSITKIASLGGTETDARKFMFAPDVVEDYGEYILLLGSGDREKPLLGYDDAAKVENYFFMLRDNPAVTPDLDDCGGSSVICLNSLYPILGDSSPTLADVAAKQGWYLALSPTEQVVTSAITIFGTVTFSTHQPALAKAPNTCTSTLGTARVYNIAYATAASHNGTADRFETVAGGGLSPSPVAGMVTLDNGETVPFCIGCNPESSLQGDPADPPPPAIQPKSRVYWNIQQ